MKFRARLVSIFTVFLAIIIFFAGKSNASENDFSLLRYKQMRAFPEIVKLIENWKYSDAFLAITSRLNSAEKLTREEKLSLMLNLTAVLKMLGRTKDAIASAMHALSIDSSSEVALYYASMLNLMLNDIDAASGYSKRLKQVDPQNPWAYFIASAIFASEGRSKRAFEEIKTAIKFERDMFEARAVLFNYYKKRKKYESARDELKKMMKLAPNFELAPFFTASSLKDKKSAENMVKSEMLYEYASLMYNYFKNPKTALKYYRQSEKLNPDHTKTRIGVAQCLALFGNIEKAREILKDIAKKNPEDKLACGFYDKLDNAESLERFININLNTLRQVSKAVKLKYCKICGTVMDHSIAECPNCQAGSLKIPEPRVIENKEKKSSGEATDENFNANDELEAKYDRCLEIGLENLEAHSYESAEVNFKEMIKLMPDSPEGYNMLGAVYLASANYDVAIKNFKRAVSLNSDYAEGYFSLAKAYEMTRQYKTAVFMYEKALKIDEEYEEAELALKKLKAALKKR